MSGSVGQPTIGWWPWVGNKAGNAPNPWVRSNVTTGLSMGEFQSEAYGAGQNTEWDVDLWLDSVTWKICQINYKASNLGIVTWQFDGSTVGTIDEYAAGASSNNYSEITGIAVATPGIKNVKAIMATKNASSANYYGYFNSTALIATSGTYSTPNGTDTPGYTHEHFYWMGTKGNTGGDSRLQGSAYLGGGICTDSAHAQSNEKNIDRWLDTGTYKYALEHFKAGDVGIYTVKLDGSSQGTIDGYNAVDAANTYSEITGIAISTAGVKNHKLQTDTKNAASSNYGLAIHSDKWIRTGA